MFGLNQLTIDMDAYEDGQKRIRAKAADQELVPVHAPSNRSIIPRYQPNFPPFIASHSRDIHFYSSSF